MIGNLFDVKHAMKRLLRDREYSLIVILTLSLCVSVSMFLYAQIYSIAYKDLPFSDSERFVQISRRENNYDRISGGISYYEAHYIKERQNTLNHFTVWEGRSVTMHNGVVTTMVDAVSTSENLFELTAVEPMLGRVFNASDLAYGAEPAAILGYDLWEKYFSRDDATVGKLVRIDDIATRIIGVMPESFEFPVNQSLWLAYEPTKPETPQGNGWVTFIGLLKPGVTLAQSRDEFSSLAQELREAYPAVYDGKSFAVYPYTEAYARPMKIPLTIMAIVAISILGMGCFSVGNLIVVRAMEQTRENMIKTAIGLPFLNIISLPLFETFILCLISGVVGISICVPAISYLSGELNVGPYWWKTESGIHIYAAGLVSVLVVWILTSIFPLVSSAKSFVGNTLSSGAKGGTSSKSGPMMKVFMSSQIFCAFTLILFTALSVQALRYVLNADYGLSTEGYLVTSVKLPIGSYSGFDERLTYYARIEQQLEELNGISQVEFTGGLPGFFGYSSTYQSVDNEIIQGEASPKAIEINVSDDYLTMMGVHLLEGRVFNEADSIDSQLVAIINKNMAAKLWPNESSVVGRQFQLDPQKSGPLITVIGVASEVVYGSPINFDVTNLSVIYRPMTQVLHGWWEMNILLKTNLTPDRIESQIRMAAEKVDHRVSLSEITSLESHLAKNGKRLKDMLYNFLPAAVLALMMSALGIYGITKRSIYQNALELGIMKCVGVKDHQISKSFIRNNIMYFLYGAIPALILMYLFLPSITQNMVSTNSMFFWTLVIFVFSALSLVVVLASSQPLMKLNELSPKDILLLNLQNKNMNE